MIYENNDITSPSKYECYVYGINSVLYCGLLAIMITCDSENGWRYMFVKLIVAHITECSG